MDCYIQTIPFMVDHNSSLRFMRWFQVPIYGSDGIYVIIVHSTGSDTLNFIGTGGALGGGRDILGDWFLDCYPLGQYAGGDTIQLRIAFKSDYDGEVAEGFYIDDINIDAITFIEDHTNSYVYPLTLNAVPNPFRVSTDIFYSIIDNIPGATDKAVELIIYDVTGRLVKTFPELSSAINHQSSVQWNGLDDHGNRVAPGIYFIMLRTDNKQMTEKIVFIR
jgi:hypothetical protein